MQINNFSSPVFNANFNSRKLRFKQDDFFVRIRGYGRDRNWANKIIKVTDIAVNLIRNDTSAENVLKIITFGVKDANKTAKDLTKRFLTGILRTRRDGWKSGRAYDLTTAYTNNKYKSYMNRFDFIAKHPLKNSYQMNYSRPRILKKDGKIILHASADNINKVLDRIFILTGNIFPKYIHKDVRPENMSEINDTIAEIRWLLAHSTPWMRGSDAISNVFTRAMYKSVGIKSYPLKKGVSLDLEAYCRELEDYKTNFTGFFTKPPEIIG